MKLDKSKYPNGMLLDVGCKDRKQPNYVGIDSMKHPGVDIVHNLEKFPYPIPSASCLTIKCAHVIEHIKPWLVMDFMNELWRMAVVDGQLMISTPYGGSQGFWADPTHCTHVTEMTWQLFDPAYPLYEQYKPKPWRMEHSAWKPGGNIEAIFRKRSEMHSEAFERLMLAEKAINLGAIQKPLELAGLFDYLGNRQLKTVVEIGTARGGVFYALCQLAEKDATIVSVDLPGGEFGGGYDRTDEERYKGYGKKGQQLFFLPFDSHDKLTKSSLEKITGKNIDLLFIDGDHTYEGVRKDWQMYSPLVKKGGIVVFHDICKHPKHPTCQVDRLWREIKLHHEVKELIDLTDATWGGIGIVEMGGKS